MAMETRSTDIVMRALIFMLFRTTSDKNNLFRFILHYSFIVKSRE